MKLVKPQHFLPVHGEYAFLCAHAQLAKDIGIKDTSVIRNGQYLGVSPRRNGKTISSGSMQLLGEAKLQMFYNDGGRVRVLAPSPAPMAQCLEGCPVPDVLRMAHSYTVLSAWFGWNYMSGLSDWHSTLDLFQQFFFMKQRPDLPH